MARRESKLIRIQRRNVAEKIKKQAEEFAEEDFSSGFCHLIAELRRTGKLTPDETEDIQKSIKRSVRPWDGWIYLPSSLLGHTNYSSKLATKVRKVWLEHWVTTGRSMTKKELKALKLDK